MCNPQAIALMAASYAVDQKNQSDARRRTNQQIALSEDRNDYFSNKIIKASDKNLEQYNPDVRIDNLKSTQIDSQESLTQALTTARDKQDANSPAATGKVSSTYTNEKAERAIARAKAGADLAKMISKVGAPSTLQNEEAINNAEASTVMGTQAIHRGDMAKASFADIKQAGKLNPSMKIISGLLRGASMAYGGGGDTGKTVLNSNTMSGLT